jgi:hypothetical protein
VCQCAYLAILSSFASCVSVMLVHSPTVTGMACDGVPRRLTRQGLQPANDLSQHSYLWRYIIVLAPVHRNF